MMQSLEAEGQTSRKRQTEVESQVGRAHQDCSHHPSAQHKINRAEEGRRESCENHIEDADQVREIDLSTSW